MIKTKKPSVDFRAVRARITMEQVLVHYNVLDTLKRTGSRLSGPCPIHGGTNPTQFRVDTNKNLWNCFSECKHGGNVLDFISKKEDISIHDAALRACEWFGIPVHEIEDAPDEEPKQAEERPAHAAPKTSPSPTSKTTPAPEDTTPNPPLKFRLEKLQRDHPYLTERGLTQETIFDFGLGYFIGNKGLMVGRVVIPIHNVKGEVVAYAGRWPQKPEFKDTPKYLLPPGFKKGQEVFNIDRAVKEPADKPLVIVEGFFDAIKLHQNGCRRAVALMGSSLSEAQAKLIAEVLGGDKRVILLFDEDNAGREGREKALLRLAPHAFVRVVVLGVEGLQPDGLSAEEVQALGLREAVVPYFAGGHQPEFRLGQIMATPNGLMKGGSLCMYIVQPVMSRGMCITSVMTPSSRPL